MVYTIDTMKIMKMDFYMHNNNGSCSKPTNVKLRRARKMNERIKKLMKWAIEESDEINDACSDNEWCFFCEECARRDDEKEE